MVYDPLTDEWNVTNAFLPSPRQGACAIEMISERKNSILLIGGKGHQTELKGSDEIWEFDPQTAEWNGEKIWPRMKRQRYYHGCIIGMLHGDYGKISSAHTTLHV